MASCPGLIILLSTLLALRASCHDVSPAITAPARLPMKVQARQTAGFAGFLSVNGDEYIPTYCNQGSTWSTSSAYCGCMPTTSVGWSIATSCLSGSVLENPGIYTCPPEEPVCYTMSYFREASDTAPLQGYGCYITPTILKIYKEIPVATSAASSTTNTAYLAPVSSPSTSSTTNGLSQSSLTSFQSTAVSQPSTTASTQSSSAWIAGPVVGAFAGGAIFIGVAFWIWHLHRRLAQSQRDLRATEVGTDKPPQGQQLPQIWPPTSAPKPQELASYHVVEAPRNELRAELPPR